MSRRVARAFTVVELAIVISVSAIVVPSAYMAARTWESLFHDAEAELRAAQGARALSEELQRDLATMRWEDEKALVLAGRGSCARVEYSLEEGVLLRRPGTGCGDVRPVARGVRSIERGTAGLEVVFAREFGRAEPHVTVFRIGVPR